MLSDGEWDPYSYEISKEIEKHLAKKERTFTYHACQFNLFYEFDLANNVENLYSDIKRHLFVRAIPIKRSEEISLQRNSNPMKRKQTK